MTDIINYVRDFGFLRSLSIFNQACVYSFKGLICSNVENKKDSYHITYTHNSETYKICCKKNRKRLQIIEIVDENDSDISINIKRFMGPFMNFHGIPTTPKDLGYNKIIFTMLNGNKHIFDHKDEIIMI